MTTHNCKIRILTWFRLIPKVSTLCWFLIKKWKTLKWNGFFQLAKIVEWFTFVLHSFPFFRANISQFHGKRCKTRQFPRFNCCKCGKCLQFVGQNNKRKLDSSRCWLMINRMTNNLQTPFAILYLFLFIWLYSHTHIPWQLNSFTCCFGAASICVRSRPLDYRNSMEMTD